MHGEQAIRWSATAWRRRWIQARVDFYRRDAADAARPRRVVFRMRQDALIALNGQMSEQWLPAAEVKVFWALFCDRGRRLCGGFS
jgi:hypothetical protein